MFRPHFLRFGHEDARRLRHGEAGARRDGPRRLSDDIRPPHIRAASPDDIGLRNLGLAEHANACRGVPDLVAPRRADSRRAAATTPTARSSTRVTSTSSRLRRSTSLLVAQVNQHAARARRTAPASWRRRSSSPRTAGPRTRVSVADDHGRIALHHPHRFQDDAIPGRLRACRSAIVSALRRRTSACIPRL